MKLFFSVLFIINIWTFKSQLSIDLSTYCDSCLFTGIKTVQYKYIWLFCIHNKQLWSGVKVVWLVVAIFWCKLLWEKAFCVFYFLNENAPEITCQNVRGGADGIHPRAWRGLKSPQSVPIKPKDRSFMTEWTTERQRLLGLMWLLEVYPWILISASPRSAPASPHIPPHCITGSRSGRSAVMET